MNELWNSLPHGAQVIGWCLGGSAALVLVGILIFVLISKPLGNAVAQDEAERGR